MRHTKKYILVVIPLLGFFGYVAYRDLLFDASTIAQEHIAVEIDQEEEHTPEYYGLKRADIALGEYRKDVFEQPRGCNCGPEIDKYTEGIRAQWCTMFTSWVAKEAGSPVKNGSGSWRITNSRNFADYLKRHGTWYDREEVIKRGLAPKLGDFVVFWRGDFEANLGHVDVVVKTGGVPGSADLVGGNLGDRVTYREGFPYLQHYGFLGFGRPEKSTE